MDTKTMLQSNYLDIIFEGRNKSYGSYQLRATYAGRMRKAGMYIFFISLLFAFFNAWANWEKGVPPQMPDPTISDTMTFINTPMDTPEPEEIFEPPAPSASDVKTENLTLVDILKDNEVDPGREMATQEALKEAVSGQLTLDGQDGGNESRGDDLIGDNKGTGHEKVLVEGTGKEKGASIPVFVEQMPEFPGGEEKLKEYIANNLQYPAKAISANKQGKLFVKFVVNEDGSISHISTIRGFGFGSEEESIRVVSGMPKWNPGRTNGKAVKVWFQLPILFRLEG